jgi:hypothetical protein
MVARVIYEFFRPRMSAPALFPVGVIAQDEGGIHYAIIRDFGLPEDVDASFYGLDDREAFMNGDLLPRLESEDPESGNPSVSGPGDPRLLEALQRRGSHHFVYSSIEERLGSARNVLDQEIQRLENKSARRELLMRFGDPTTRAILNAYG